MERRDTRSLGEFIAAVTGAISGVISLGLILWSMATWYQSFREMQIVVQSHSKTIELFREQGSQSLVTHAKVQDEIQRLTEARLKRLEDAMTLVAQMQTDIMVIRRELEWWSGQRGKPQGGRIEQDEAKPQVRGW